MKGEGRRPAVCLKLSERENRMLDVLSERFGMCKSEVLRYMIRREWEKEAIE